MGGYRGTDRRRARGRRGPPPRHTGRPPTAPLDLLLAASSPPPRIAIAVGSGGLAWWAAGRSRRPRLRSPRPSPPPPGLATPAALGVATPRYDAAVADLQRVLAAGRGTLDTSTVRVLEQNLAVIDRAIADAQRALAADPGNAYLNAHLARTMRRKLDLLRQAATLAAAQS